MLIEFFLKLKQGGLPVSVEALQLQARQVPAGSIWQVIGIGRRDERLDRGVEMAEVRRPQDDLFR